jgi:hypothetical protein
MDKRNAVIRGPTHPSRIVRFVTTCRPTVIEHFQGTRRGAGAATSRRVRVGLREAQGELAVVPGLVGVVGRVTRPRDGQRIGRQPQVREDAARGLALGDDGDHP